MVTVLQDPISRAWGFKVEEDLGGMARQRATRVLYEDYSFSSPGEVFSIISDIQKSFQLNRVRSHKKEGFWTYEVGAPGSNDIILSESGWPIDQQSEMMKQMALVAENIKDTPKMYTPPKPIQMAIGGSSEGVDTTKVDSSWVGKVDDE